MELFCQQVVEMVYPGVEGSVPGSNQEELGQPQPPAPDFATRAARPIHGHKVGRRSCRSTDWSWTFYGAELYIPGILWF